jgi:hypothetical protein
VNNFTQSSVYQTFAALYFDAYHTYLALVEYRQEGYVLSYINSTRQPVDFSLSSAELEQSTGVQEIEQLAEQLATQLTHTTVQLAVTVTMEHAAVHHIPFTTMIKTGEIRQLMNLEIAHHFPARHSSDVLAMLYPLTAESLKTPVHEALAVLIDKNISIVSQRIATILGAHIQRVVVSQCAAQMALAANYAHEAIHTVALIGIQRGFLDVSIVHQHQLVYFRSRSLEEALEAELNKEDPDEERTFGSACKTALDNAADELGLEPIAAFFFGADLTKPALDEIQEILIIPSYRLNPFRQFSTNLEPRQRAYCARVAHIVVPCIGAALPEVQSSIIVSSNIPTSTLAYRRKTA